MAVLAETLPSDHLSSQACLAVRGLSPDATKREVHILFSGCAGYLCCDLLSEAYALVQFGDFESARRAARARRGTTWEEGGDPVCIGLAGADGELQVEDEEAPEEAAAGQRAAVAAAPQPGSGAAAAAAGGLEDKVARLLSATAKAFGFEVAVTPVSEPPIAPPLAEPCPSSPPAAAEPSPPAAVDPGADASGDGAGAGGAAEEAAPPVATVEEGAEDAAAVAAPAPAAHGGSEAGAGEAGCGVHEPPPSAVAVAAATGAREPSEPEAAAPAEASPGASESEPTAAGAAAAAAATPEPSEPEEPAPAPSPRPCAADPGPSPAAAEPLYADAEEASEPPEADSDCQELVAGQDVDRIGVSISHSPDGRVFVTKTVPGTWGERVGLAPGDEILELNGLTPSAAGRGAVEAAMRTQRPLRLRRRRAAQDVVSPLPLAPLTQRSVASSSGSGRASVAPETGAGGGARRGTAQVTNAKATAALLKLRAALTGRKAQELEMAIEEVSVLGLELEELAEAKRLLASFDKKAAARRATAAEGRALGKLKKGQDLLALFDVPAEQRAEAMREAERAADEAIFLCEIAGLKDAKQRLQRALRAAQEGWRGGAKAKLFKALRRVASEEDQGPLLRTALLEAEYAGLAAQDAPEDCRAAVAEAREALALADARRAARAALAEALRGRAGGRALRAAGARQGVGGGGGRGGGGGEDGEEGGGDAGRPSAAEARWALLAVMVGERDREASDLPANYEAVMSLLSAVEAMAEAGLPEAALEGSSRWLRLLASDGEEENIPLHEDVEMEDGFQPARPFATASARRLAKVAVEELDRRAEARAVHRQEQHHETSVKAQAQEALDAAAARRDVESLKRAIEESQRLGLDPSLLAPALTALAEEEMLAVMDEAVSAGDLEKLEKAIHAWQAQGLDPEVLVDAQGMLEEVRVAAQEVQQALDPILRRPLAFETDGMALVPEGRAVIKEVAALLVRFPAVAIEIHGFSSCPRPEAARELSQMRAETVRTALRDAGCVNPLRTKAWGQPHPHMKSRTVRIFARWAPAQGSEEPTSGPLAADPVR